MKQTMIVVVLALALAFSPAAAGYASSSSSTRATAQVVSLRHAVVWHRSRTWYWQDRAGVARTVSRHVERRTTSAPFLRWVARLWGQRRVAARRHYATLARTSSSSIVAATICRVFGAARCATAKAIAWTESKWSTHPYPPNPTHFGIFQLDASAIAAYARGRYSTVLDQVRAAFRMYLARGWEPWTCCEG